MKLPRNAIKKAVEQAARTVCGVAVTPFATLRGQMFRVNANSAPSAGFPPRSTPCGSAARYADQIKMKYLLTIIFVVATANCQDSLDLSRKSNITSYIEHNKIDISNKSNRIYYLRSFPSWLYNLENKRLLLSVAPNHYIRDEFREMIMNDLNEPFVNKADYQIRKSRYYEKISMISIGPLFIGVLCYSFYEAFKGNDTPEQIRASNNMKYATFGFFGLAALTFGGGITISGILDSKAGKNIRKSISIHNKLILDYK